MRYYQVFNQSFFEDNKAFVIFRSTDKSLDLLRRREKKITDTKIILLSERLDKNLKLETFLKK